MIDNKIVAKNHQKMEKNALFLKKCIHFLGKFAQKVFHIRVFIFHIRVCLCSKNSGRPHLYSIFEFYSIIEYSIFEFILYYIKSKNESPQTQKFY